MTIAVDRRRAAALLEELSERRVILRAEGENLRLQAPKGVLTPSLRQELARLKPQVLELLRGGGNGDGEVVATAPLSPVQRGLWLLARLEPDDRSYHLAVVLRVQGELRLTVLERAVAEIIRRHGVLRTTFDEGTGGPLQTVHPPWTPRLAAVSGEGWDAEATEDWIDGEIGQPFDLESGPVFRASCVRLAARRHVVVLCHHHIVGDAWSMGVLLRELEALYSAFANGSPSPLPEPPLTYAAHASGVHRRFSSGEWQPQLDFWRRQLTPLPPILAVPADRRRGAADAHRGGHFVLPLDMPLIERLRTVGRQAGATLFMTLAAAFDLLLGRLTGERDVALAVPVAGRDRRETEILLGLFVNTLVLRTDFSEADDFPALLDLVRRSALDAYSHADLPFGDLVRELRPPRQSGRTPIVRVMFNLADVSEIRLALPGLDTAARLREPGSRFDSTLYVLLDGDSARLEVAWDLDLFDRRRMQELLGQYRQLLEQVAERPDRRLVEYSLRTPGFPILEAGPSPIAPDLVHRRFARSARRAGDRAAVCDGERVLSYAELAEDAGRLANYLRSRGVGRGDVVAVLGARSAELPWALLGILETGAAFAVLDPEHPEERLVTCVEAVEPSGWIRLSPRAVGGALDTVFDRVLDRLSPRVRLDRPMAADAPWRDCSPQSPTVELVAGDLAYVAFTSGTTGRPLAIASPHRALAHYLAWFEHSFGGRPDDRFSLLAGLGHDPLARDVFAPLTLGATLCCPPPGARRDGARLASWMLRERITRSHLTPAMGELLIGSGEQRLPALRDVFFGGDVLPPPAVQRLAALAPGVTQVNFYGTTETPQAMAFHQVPAAVASDSEISSVPLGRGIAGVELLVLDPAGQPAGCGELGEIAVAAPHLARGYLGDPARTAERFVPGGGEAGDRLYLTGDLGRYRPDGEVELAGRADRQLRIRGHRVEPAEIEAALARHPAVVRAVVVTRTAGGAGKELLTAYLVARQGVPEDQEIEPGLRAALRACLPAFMVPAVFSRLDALPLTPNGKIDLAALPEPRPIRPTPAASTPEEEVVTGLWVEILGHDRIAPEDDFFVLGGHSLLAPRLLARARERLGIDMTLVELFARPTVAAMAARMDGRGRREEPPLEPVARADWRPSATQRRLWFLAQLDLGSAAYLLARAFVLRGQLDAAALDRALCAIVRRHRVLRGTLVDAGGEPRLIVRAAPASLLATVDLAALPEQARRNEARRWRSREARRPFDLAAGPFLRAVLLRLDEREHLLLLTLHHVAADAGSIAVLSRELAELYVARRELRPAALAEPAMQYADFAAWQERRARDGAHAEPLAYWRRQLQAPQRFELPFARPRRAGRALRGAVERLTLPMTLGESLRALGRSAGTTLFMTLLASWKLLLGRLSGHSDLAVGTAVSQRPPTAEGLVGLFLDTVVLRTCLVPRPGAERPPLTFFDLLARVRRTVLDAFAHQDVPFERLVAEVDPERDLDRTPFFQVFFNLIDTGEHRFELAGLDMEELPRAPELTAKLDLALHVIERAGMLEAVLVYDAELYDSAYMGELLAQLRHLLDQIVARPEAPVGEHSLITPDKRSLLPDPTVELEAPLYPPPTESFLTLAERAPDRTALRHRDEAWSYGRLAAAARAVAAGLLGRGLAPGDAVAVHGERSFELVAAVLGVFLGRGVLVLVDRELPLERRLLMVRETEARFLIELDTSQPPWTEVQDERTLHMPVTPVKPAELPEIESGDAAYVFFTSGSTGKPRCVVGTHQGLGHFLAWQRTEFDVGPGDRVAQLATLSFDAVLRDILLPLTSGATLVLPDPRYERDPLEWLTTERVTVAHLIPSVAQLWLAEGTPSVRPSALRWLFFVGEPLPGELVRRFRALCGPATRVINLYGPTETTLVKCFSRVPAPAADGTQPVGRPMPQTQALVLGAGDRPCSVGEAGEIVLRTPFRSRGYLADSEATFDANPFGPEDPLYRTGDRGYFRPDGELAILGRLDRQVKVRGVRIEPGEVEAALTGHRAVSAAAVVAHRGPENTGERRLVAFLLGESLPESRVLRDFLRERLPAALVPSSFVTLAELPRTATGKIDRRSLERQDLSREAGTAVVPPGTATEKALVALWHEVLGAEEFGVHDDFFDLGGHSLLATRLSARLRKRFGTSVPLRRLFEAPTVAALASFIDQAAALAPPEGEPHLVPAPDPEDGYFSLSPGQRRLWFLEQLEPGSGAYHVTRSLPLEGVLDVAALERGLVEIVRRHGALRTAYRTRDGQPVQRLAPPPPRLSTTVDLRRLGAARRRRLSRSLLERQVDRPFDLSRGALLRVLVLRLGEERWHLFLSFHHIAVDGGSLEIFGRELGVLYRAFRSGRPSPLADPPIRYVDFALWQSAWLRGERRRRLLGYWRRQLADLPNLELATDRPRPVLVSPRGGRCHLRLTRAEMEPLAALARRRGATLFMTLLTVFETLLHRVTGLDDVAVGTPVANRPRPELESLIGFFVNTLVLRGDLRGDPTLIALLDRLRETCLDAYGHQDLPFEDLVKALDPERDTSRNPFFQMFFALQELPERSGLQGMAAGPVETHGLAAKFDLQLALIHEDGALRGFLEYRSDLFDATTARRLVGHYRCLLASCAERPEARLGELALLTPAERHQVRSEMNDTVRDLGADLCLHTLLAERARRCPAAVAVSFGSAQLTYAGLQERAGALAHHLQTLGVGPETRVAVAMERSLEMVIALVAVLEAGGAYLPLDPAYPRKRLELLVRDARCPVLLTQQRLLPRLPESTARVLCVDGDVTGEVPKPLGQLPERHLDSATVAYVIYTSGSTGRPKGVMCSHRGIVNRLRWMQDAYRLEPGDRVLLKTPYSFDVSVWELFWPLAFGARLVIARPEGHRDTDYLRAVLDREAISTLHFVPSMLRIFLDQGGLGGHPNLRRVFASGEALPRALARRFLAASSAELHNLYGPTEAAVDVTYHPCRPGEKTVPIGRPIANIGIHLLDRRLRPVPIGVPGELLIGGVGLARGYLGRPGLTAQRFVPDAVSGAAGERLYRTGDRARRLSGGEVDYLGRDDHQIKIRGFRVELGEIETALLEDPALRQAIVTVSDGRLVAYVVSAPEAETPRAQDLRASLSHSLPDHMVPATFVPLDSLPLLPNGKIDRKALPAPGSARAELERRLSEPRTDAERTLCGLWAEVLGLGRVGIHDNFFELGGDSILSIRIVSRARRQSLLLTARDFFQHQTVSELARIAGRDERLGAAGQRAEQGLITGPVPLTPIQHWFFERDLPEPWHVNWTALLRAPRGFDPARLGRVAAQLERHHDALRLRFRRVGESWEQHNAGVDGASPRGRVDLTRLDAEAGSAALERAAADLQRGLDLERGPLWRLTWFDCAAGARAGRLHLVVHHLAVDGVSWRILHEDLATLSGAIESASLPAKTPSFKSWAEALATATRSETWVRQLDFWLAQGRDTPLPRDLETGANDVGSAEAVTETLSTGETRRLLQRVPAAYRTRIDDVLLTAVALGFRALTGRSSLSLDLESHGRDEIRPDLDVARTVGWFTALYPVRLELPANGGRTAALKVVKETLRAIPAGGRGFGLLRYLGAPEDRDRLAALSRPEILFNYLGRGDGASSDGDGGALSPAAESAGSPHGRRGARSHLLEMVGDVREGRLVLRLVFSRNRHLRTTIEDTLTAVVDELRALIEHCCAPGAVGYTPSDFSLAGLDQATIDRQFSGDAGIEDVYPTTPTQEAIFYYHLYNPASTAYHDHLSCLLEGRLDVERLRRVADELLERHPVLRTALVWESLDEPLQVVRRRVVLPGAELDWRGLGPDEQRARLLAFVHQDRRRGFELGRAPLMRWTLVRLDADRYLLVWSYHHLVLDGWSLPVLLQEVFTLYRASTDPVPAVRPFRDFVAWLGEHDRERAMPFWRRALRDFASATPLPFDRPDEGGAGRGEEIRSVQSRLPAEATARLNDFVRGRRLTLNTLAQAAWALTLSRFSGRREVLFGVTLAGRPAELVDVENMVGLFINTVPVPVSTAPAQDLLPWLAELQAWNAELRQYDDSRLFDLHRASRVPPGQALFQSVILFQNYPLRDSRELAGSGVFAHGFESFGTTSYPLTLTFKPQKRLHVGLAYDARRFDATTARRMLALCGHFLRHLGSDSPSRLGELPVLGASERHQVLREWNDTTAGDVSPVAVSTLFARQLARRPDGVAVVGEDGQLSYRELARRSHRLARGLRALGVGPEVAVAVFMVRAPEMVVALLAVLEAEGAYVPLDPLFPEERLAFVLDEIGTPVILTQRRLVKDLPPTRATVILLDGAELTPLPEVSRARTRSAPLSAPAYVIYTSGSTGQPKGVAVSRRALAAYVATAAECFELSAADRVLQFASVSFDTSAEEIFPALASGATLVLRTESMLESPAVFARTLGAWRISVVDLPTAYWHQLAAVLPDGVRLPESLRLVIIGGESAHFDRLRTWRRHVGESTRLLNTYGPTEATIVATARDLAAPSLDTERSVPLGLPLRNVLAHVLDGSCDPAPVGIAGELYLGGAGLARGYLRRPGLTAERFVPDPHGASPGARLYRTGDAARRRPDGELEFLGRLDHQVKLRGLRIELGEIEAALVRHDDVREAAVVVDEPAGGRARLAAYIVSPAGVPAPPARELRDCLKQSLPFYMLPAVFVGLESLPLLPSGKVDRRSLPAADRSLPSDRDYVAPRTDTEKALAEVWAEVLDVERVGAHDEYFDLGGDSLHAVRLMARVGRRFGVRLSLAQLFADFTVEAVARLIDGDGVC